MNILFITNNLPPIVDGVGDYTYNLACEFARHGHNVHIICRKCEQIRVDYSDLKVVPMVEKWNRVAGKQIVEYIRDNGIDVVSLQYVPHGFHPKGLPFGLISCLEEIKKTNVKIMTFCHEVSVEYQKGNLKQRLLEFLMKRVTRRILKISDYVSTSIVHYRDMIAHIDKRNKDIAIIPIVSNIPETDIQETERQKLRRTIANDDEIIIAFFGMRNTASCLAAIKNFQDKGHRIKILFIGKIPAAAKGNLPNDSFKTGVLDVKDIYKYFLVADIMMLPENNISGCSFKSGSLAAAMRVGLPIITAKGYLTDSILVNGRNIVFTDFVSIENIEKSISGLLADEKKRLEIGSAAKQLVGNRTWEYTYNEYMKVLS